MTRIYRACLRLLPASFRYKYGEDMESAFEETIAARRGLSRTLVLPLALVDIGRARFMFWRDARRGHRPQFQKRRTLTMELLLTDIRYAWRSLRNRWALALLALATLAMGIGATTSVFSVVNGVL